MRFKIKEGVTTIEEDNELVIFDVTGEKFFGLDVVASIIWSKLEIHKNSEEISRYISSLYNVSFDQAKQDVNLFLNVLLEKGLIKKQ